PTAPVVTTTTVPAPTTTTRPTKGPGPGSKSALLTPKVTPTAPVVTTTTTAPAPTTNASSAMFRSCKPDPAAAIAALPSGGVFNGSGCYKTAGILITKPVTIDGGTFIDPVVTELTHGYDGIEPIIRIKDTSGVTVQNVTVTGLNSDGGYHRDLVGQEGIRVLSSANITLTNIITNNTFGDGLILGFQPGRPRSTNITVNGLVVNSAGRQGVTVAYATNSTLNDVTINSSADAGWDFESDP